MMMCKIIKIAVLILLHVSFAIFLVALFVDLSKFTEPAEHIISALQNLNININNIKNISLIAGLTIFLISMAWSLYELSSGMNYTERKRELLKRTIILHPISGVVSYYLSSSIKTVADLITDRRVVSWLYYLRILFFVMFCTALFGLFFIKNIDAVLVIFILSTFASIGLHYVFEVIVFTDILNKPDNEIFDKGLDSYFHLRQPILAYSDYFKSDIKLKHS
jgi:hypothetical protein